MRHSHNPATWEAEADGRFEDNLSHMVSARLAWAMLRDAAFKDIEINYNIMHSWPAGSTTLCQLSQL